VKTSIKHIGLISGIVIVLLSFLFFGRQQEIYHFILVCGLLTSLVSFLWILFGKDSFRSKLFWCGVAILGMALVWALEGFFIDLSYRIFLHTKRQELASVNILLKDTPGEVWIMGDSIKERPLKTLSISDKELLMRDFEKLGVYMILKSDSTIYYELWGFLDVRLGITYGINGRLPEDHYRHLKGNWYH
jgi:hypothetical protein